MTVEAPNLNPGDHIVITYWNPTTRVTVLAIRLIIGRGSEDTYQRRTLGGITPLSTVGNVTLSEDYTYTRIAPRDGPKGQR